MSPAELFRLLRLHETSLPAVRINGVAREIYLESRRFPGRRRRPYPPTHRTRSTTPFDGKNAKPLRKNEPVSPSSGRCRRNLSCLENGHANTSTPTALILSRQNINDLPARNNRYEIAAKAEKGAYIVSKNGENPDVILIASGSEVATLVEAAELLTERKGIHCQIVSAISEGLFRQQPLTYQNEVIPADKPKFGLTAGLSVTLEGLVGNNGKIHGVNHFGYSAPAKVLDEKFGFTGEFVYQEICHMLGK